MISILDKQYMGDAEIHDYLKEHRVMWTYDFSWPGGHISGGPFPSGEECDRHYAANLAKAKYRPPSILHFWRWGERSPGRKVLGLLNQMAEE